MRTLLQKWWWLVAALVTFFVVDNVIHAVFRRCTDNDAVVRGEAILDALDSHPEVELFVLGDSSGRWGVNTNIITASLGVSSWNLATFHGGFPAQLTLLEREVERGRKIRAILFVHTENGQAKYIGHEGPEITMAYFLTPQAISYWYGNDLIDTDTAAQWSWALFSNVYRDGKGLERFVMHLPTYGWPELVRRWDSRGKQRVDHFENRGHSRGTDRTGPGLSEFDYFIQVILMDQGWKFENHKDVDEWNERLLEFTDRNGIKVFFAFTPRMEKILAHPKWAPKVGDPTRAWAKALNERHSTFELLAPDPFGAKPDEFYDTADHLNAVGAERYSRWIADRLRGRL